ncbi:MAG: hypothetical protein ACRENM_04725, partial [Candidatus Dormibacteraceae bacterium]
MSSHEPPTPRLNWSAATPFVVTGLASITAGGLMSALTASAPSRHSSWLVAYLVLVVGVAQIAVGAGQAVLARRPISPAWLTLELLAFNVGNLLVVIGTLLYRPPLVDAGGTLFGIGLILFLAGVRGSEAS